MHVMGQLRGCRLGTCISKQISLFLSLSASGHIEERAQRTPGLFPTVNSLSSFHAPGNMASSLTPSVSVSFTTILLLGGLLFSMWAPALGIQEKVGVT